MTTAAASPRRTALALLLAYPPLALAGALAHLPLLSLCALLVLLSAWMAPRLATGAVGAWVLWAGVASAMAVLAWFGLAEPLLEAVPVLAIALLAGWFGATLRAGREPRVAGFIRVLEGDERLALPEVSRYARGVTVFWTVLLAAQALALGTLLLAAMRDPGALPGWAPVYQHVGGYLLVPLAFAAEYAFRRWHLRHLPHPGLHAQGMRMVRLWPRLLHGARRP